jgi:stage V sporulation protein G
MLITAIKIRRIENSGTKMRGVASINLDNMVVIHDIKVLEADGKSFLAMPSKQTKVGTFKDMVHVRVREAFETLIIGGYEKAEKEGYTKIDLIYNDSGKKNLTEQTVEDFVIQGGTSIFSATGYVPINTGEASIKHDSSKVSPKKMNDNLLKWIEG